MRIKGILWKDDNQIGVFFVDYDISVHRQHIINVLEYCVEDGTIDEYAYYGDFCEEYFYTINKEINTAFDQYAEKNFKNDDYSYAIIWPDIPSLEEELHFSVADLLNKRRKNEKRS